MVKRRRFGVSIREQYFKLIEELAERLGTTRSNIVERAIYNFMSDHVHYLDGHECAGLLIVHKRGSLDLSLLMEKYRDIVQSVSHYHLGGSCLDVIIVKGDSKRIADIDRELISLGCRTRFIPIHSLVGQAEEG